MRNKKEYDLITFGEILLRFSPPAQTRLADTDVLEKNVGGAELNVACGMAQLGLRTAIVSVLPHNGLGASARKSLRFSGVSDEYLLEDSDSQARLGVYYYETGAAPRKPSVIYDRADSSAAQIQPEDIPQRIFSSARLFHTSGISLALSDGMRRTAEEMLRRSREEGALISFDVNYRANLWREDTARDTIQKLLPMVDILFISEESCRRMFQKTGGLREILKGFAGEYGLKYVFTTQRKVVTPRRHDFTSLAYDAIKDAYYTEEPYRGIEVIDRIGSGDAYVSGALYGLLEREDAQEAVRYGNAMAAVKSTVPGDMPSTSLAEINQIIADHHADGPVSEMNR